MKDVVVAVRSSPLTTGRVHEALRMALGLTLSNHQVTVAYMGDGATAALQMEGTILMRPGLEDSLELFEACRIREVVELESVPQAHRAAIRQRIEPMATPVLAERLTRADVVMTW